MTHTPGPWEPQDTTMGLDVVSKQRRIAALYDLNLTTTWANARLIAAAPDLLAALKAFAFHFSPLSDNDDDARSCFKLAHAAIAKATGAP